RRQWLPRRATARRQARRPLKTRPRRRQWRSSPRPFVLPPSCESIRWARVSPDCNPSCPLLLAKTGLPRDLILRLSKKDAMKIVAVADLPGTLPDTPDCDLLLLGGDLCPLRDHSLRFQQEWLAGPFARWLAELPARHIIGVAGNHDFLLEQRPDLLP